MKQNLCKKKKISAISASRAFIRFIPPVSSSNQVVDALPLLHRNSTVAHVSRSGAGPGYPHL